ncbi:2-nitropropane dioxygenase [Rhodoferax sp. TH121]|uniref:NAD(P)H-dependent flavin oxidoreductase n=1 Tax=Rhodoferax sp. TH121 TaxID=2022803 RepID=UPI000B96B8F8|nr:nitronate monooxygenase [Rhodoferax sp. TH121]OYQ41159.1 2-nitropropane dioxygenase [Rhodoferax sp. TH121]
MPNPSFLGSTFPLIQAPMAGVQGHALAAAVCNAGGLGSIPAAMLSLEALRNELTQLTALTHKPYNVNFFCHTPPQPDPQCEAGWQQALSPFYEELGLSLADIVPGPGRAPFSEAVADVVEAFKPAVMSFHFGLPPDALLTRVKSWGSLVLASATTVEEALWLQAHGADAIIAQGLEAGGHRGIFLSDDLTTQVGTMVLVPQIVRAVRVPVIAAGGIADVQGVAAAMAVGASAVQIGTAYMCCPEATTSALHRAVLQSADARQTALTNLFTGRPARGIMNRLMRELGTLSPTAPAFPLAASAIAPLRARAESLGRTDFTPLWSGQNASQCQPVPAADLTRALADGLVR